MTVSYQVVVNDYATGLPVYDYLHEYSDGRAIGKQKWLGENQASPELYTLPSLTIPDEGLTVRQILNSYTTGMPLNNQSRIPVYNGEDYIPDFTNMDLADRETYLEQVRETVLTKTEELKNLKLAQQAATKKAKELAEELAAAAMAERLKNNTTPNS